MLAKYWKRIGIGILVVACLINIGYKIIQSTSLREELAKLSNKSENTVTENVEKIKSTEELEVN